ncbi:MAG TPA: AI-2E family transporter [Steroidobacteraceae bacterium]|nr:AI-2E family transporter [Steroidobacteraceae bacterium]
MHEPPEASHGHRAASATLTSRSLMILAACALGALLYFASEVFIPIVLALLFALILSSAVEAMHRRGLRRPFGASLVLLAIVTLLGVIVNEVAGPAEQWFARLPQTLQTIETKIRPVRQAITRLEDLTVRADTLGAPGTRTGTAAAIAPAAPASVPTVTAMEVVLKTRSGIVGTVTVIILTLFLLSGGPPMLARMTSQLGEELYSTHILKIIEAIRTELGRYYGTIALINLGLGTATGIVMLLLGVPNALLWGTMAAVLNFIPYVGSAITLLVLAVVSIVSFDRLGQMFAVVASYLALATIEGQIVQPLFVGKRLAINPLVVFLAIWFGGWMWGIAGIIIAVPGLVALKVAAEHSRGGKALLAFLGEDLSKPVMLKRITAKRAAKKT